MTEEVCTKNQVSFTSMQLEFLKNFQGQSLLLGASNLINSPNWTGELWYFKNEKQMFSCNGTDGEISFRYPLIFSVADGVFVNEEKVLIGNDKGTLALYTITNEVTNDNEDFSKCSLYNNVCCTEHDHAILSVSISQHNKVITGSMDCSIKIWDLEKFVSEITYYKAHAHHVTSVHFKNENLGVEGNGCNDLFLSASLDGYCLLWDRRKQFPASVVSQNHSSGYTTAEWLSNNCDIIALGCENGNLIFEDIRYIKESKPLYSNCVAFKKSINAISPYTYNETKLIAVSEDSNTLKVFEWTDDDENLKEIYRNTDHRDYVKDFTWIVNAEKQILLSCSWDSYIIKHFPFDELKNKNI